MAGRRGLITQLLETRLLDSRLETQLLETRLLETRLLDSRSVATQLLETQRYRAIRAEAETLVAMFRRYLYLNLTVTYNVNGIELAHNCQRVKPRPPLHTR